MDGNLNVLKGDREPMYYIDMGEQVNPHIVQKLQKLGSKVKGVFE